MTYKKKFDKKSIVNKAVGYHRLLVWQVADELAWEVYKLTDPFPKSELFGITSQLRRAVLSVPLNIVEGYSRNSKNEFRQFLRIALGSLAEVDYLLQFCLKRKYIKELDYSHVSVLRIRCGALLWRLMKSL